MTGNDALIEIPQAVPEDVTRFAKLLIDDRRLPVPIEVQRIPAAATDIAATLRQNMSAIADVAGFELFADWAAQWVKDFGERTDASELTLVLMHARQPTCPKFHVDNVAMRFISTLTGPGSEWLRPQDVDLLEDGSICQAPNPMVIQQMAPASVGLFKGGKRAGGGVVHRSPSVTADRVLMKMDIAA